MGWGKEAQRWKMTGSLRTPRWRAFPRSWPVLRGLLSSVTERGSERPSCCSYIGHVTAVLPILTGSQSSPTSGCCDWTRIGPPPPSHLAGVWARRSPGSGHLWELWRYLRTQRCSPLTKDNDQSRLKYLNNYLMDSNEISQTFMVPRGLILLILMIPWHLL